MVNEYKYIPETHSKGERRQHRSAVTTMQQNPSQSKGGAREYRGRRWSRREEGRSNVGGGGAEVGGGGGDGEP